MQRYYSLSTGTTYLEGIHLEMPSDARPISEALFLDVIANPDPSKTRSHDADGLPILIDPPTVVLTVEALADRERALRDSQVSATEWLVTRHRDELDMQRVTTLTAERFAELLVYRQTLRDWPQDGHFPSSEFRPVAPTWLADHLQQRPAPPGLFLP